MKRALRKLRPFDVVESFELNGKKFEVEWTPAGAQREVDCINMSNENELDWACKYRNTVEKCRNTVALYIEKFEVEWAAASAQWEVDCINMSND